MGEFLRFLQRGAAALFCAVLLVACSSDQVQSAAGATNSQSPMESPAHDTGAGTAHPQNTSEPTAYSTDTGTATPVSPTEPPGSGTDAGSTSRPDITGLPTHRILLVFVSEITAYYDDPQNWGDSVFIDHRLSELERQIGVLTARHMQSYLNRMLDGIVTFEVDYYFTDEPVTDSILFAYSIPELADVIRGYDAVITSTSVGKDADHVLGNRNNQMIMGGWVSWDDPMHAWVNIDVLTVMQNWAIPAPFRDTRLANFEAMLSLDENDQLWQRLLYVYIHEFVHTAGSRVYNVGDWTVCDMFHEVLFLFPQAVMDQDGVIHENDYWLSHLEAARLYLRDEAQYEGRGVGIPQEFWHDPHGFSDFRS